MIFSQISAGRIVSLAKLQFYSDSASWTSAPRCRGNTARSQRGRLWWRQPSTLWGSRPEPVQSGDTRGAKRSSTRDPKIPWRQKWDFFRRKNLVWIKTPDKQNSADSEQQTHTCLPPDGRSPTGALCRVSSPTWQRQQQRASRGGQTYVAMATSLSREGSVRSVRTAPRGLHNRPSTILRQGR